MSDWPGTEVDVQSQSFDAARDQLVNTALMLFLAFSLPLLATSLYRAVHIGWQPLMYFHIGLTLVMWLIALFRRRLSFRFRSLVILGMMFLIGVAGLVAWGHSGMGSEVMVACVALAAVFFGIRYGLYAAAATLAVTAAVGVGSHLGWVVFDFDPRAYATAPSAWLSGFFTLALLAFMVVMTSGRLQNILLDAVRTLGERTDQLQDINDQLTREIAGRQRVEAALLASEMRFRELAEMLPDTIFEVDTEGRLTFANDRAFEQFGYDQEDFEDGLSAFDMVVPEDRQQAVDNVAKLLRGEVDVRRNEYTALRKDGGTFSILIHSAPVLREGFPVGLRGVIVDITDLKRTEEELRQAHDELELRVQARTAELETANGRLLVEVAERKATAAGLKASEERYRGLLDNLDDVVYTLGVDGTISFISKQVRRYGYEPNELLGRHFSEVIYPPDRELVAGDLDKSLQEEEEEEERKPFVFRLLTEDGEPRWCEERGRLMRDERGAPSGVSGIIRDITERHRYEAEMAALQKVRQAVRQMRLADDFRQLLGVVEESMKILEIPFAHSAINVLEMDCHPPRLRNHSLSPNGEWRGDMPIPGIHFLLETWRSGEALYRRDLQTEDPYGEYGYIANDYGPSVRSVLDVPFSHGTLAVNSMEPEAFSEEHIASLRLLAEVLSEGFRRMEDLRRLESRSRKLARIRRELEQQIAEKNAELSAMRQGAEWNRPDAPLDSEAKTRLAALLEILTGELADSWEDLFPTPEIVYVQLFAEKLRELGDEYAFPPLANLGERLLAQGSAHQFDELAQSLEEYPRLIDQVKSLNAA